MFKTLLEIFRKMRDFESSPETWQSPPPPATPSSVILLIQRLKGFLLRYFLSHSPFTVLSITLPRSLPRNSPEPTRNVRASVSECVK